MKAMQAAERGGYEALRLADVPPPQRQAGQALVRVTSAGVTPPDRTVLAGLPTRCRHSLLWLSDGGAAPVDGEERAGYIAGARGHEERDKGGDLGALGCPLHQGGGTGGFGSLVGHPRVDGAWGDRVDSDSGRCVFGCP
jgi:NADPH:quinone reductase-like Zn-dependent oxidoreductase